ncbi:origin recognition complex subunit 1 isoform X5 [Rhopalosiphum maidis]|uniref:origin recognition complex subunit 1 isoform X5 n=1 Tax=Rhopalosiphum maidis TaxID=43146 RepID=UPI000EFE6038|nr:origin recognition complex subunit 1 isoform X5 [Rhopalosiphum maidis]
MVNSSSEKSSTPCTRLRLKNELSSSRRSLRYKNFNEISNECDSHNNSSKTKTPQSTKKVDTVTEPNNRRLVEDTIIELCELKLNIKRVDESNYVSTLSPSMLKMTNEKLKDNGLDKFSSLPSTPKVNSRKSLRWSERHDNDLLNLVEEALIESDITDTEDELSNIPKRRSRRVSSSSSRKSNDVTNILSTKRLRKSVDRFGDVIDLNEIETPDSPEKKRTRQPVDENINTPKSNKKGRKVSIIDEDDEADIWKTPKNKHLRQSVTPRSGSRVRRSILQDIPENKEIEISTPKTPRKTPKTHVKNLTASVSKRLDSGARIPCSPLEKARANLHLHAAPKHLPCREFEYKSIHSFLVRKINDELTGSMYISGVPGTGKTATVKRVIDSLNADLLMKHSFKFIEINGLRLANPHQAFSVIWKDLTGETVSSSRAQTLLNDYFSSKKVKELSTILLVDEVDHICNRKQDVVYNILDWPSQTGSKVVVITIANTMDLPERVLRGCVTSRMGLTRLVFKPYTFQQLQEIIMNRLIGNSTFDLDAVQLVARKVAAISGDARRALDICRRAIDLIKSEDDSQLITINHVNQVLNSILSGVRVTAIRCCCLFEQFFLRALRDETSSTGIEHSTIESVYTQLKSICLLEGEELPNEQQILIIAYRLRDSGLIFLEKKRWDIFRKVSLNVSPEDISYALDKYND